MNQSPMPNATLEIMFDTSDFGSILASKLNNFFGPRAKFQSAIESATTAQITQFVDAVQYLQTRFVDTDSSNTELDQFELLMKLALLRLGKLTDLPRLLKLLNRPSLEDTSKIKAQTHIKNWAKSVSEKLQTAEVKIKTDIDKWSIAEWRLATMYAQIDMDGDPSRVEEKTPLFFAATTTKSRAACVLWLHARRSPGPGLVTPDWWRLGLTPLGDKDEMIKGIHYGFKTVLNDLEPENQFHITWWLQEMTSGGGWPESISGNCDSANGAAACLALALDKRTTTQSKRPLLDDRAGISVRLRSDKENSDESILAENKLLDLPLFYVEGIQNKYVIAEDAGLLTMPMHSTNVNELTSVGSGSSPQTPIISTLDEAFQSLLATSSMLHAAKQKLVDGRSIYFPVNAARSRSVYEKPTDAAITEYFSRQKRRQS